MPTKDRLKQLCGARDRLREFGPAAMSIDEIANASAISRFHFSRQFKAVFGETPVQFRTRSRLDRASHLLVATDDSVTDICLAVGFTSLGSFCTLFATRFGRTPSEYRNALQGSVEELTPACMAILQRAWIKKTQISRSQQAPEQVI